MQKQKQNRFIEKFKLLNSQELAADINWSSSDSSDFENVSNNDKHIPQTLKRKRKKKVPKNTSNLNITIIDVPKDRKEVVSLDKSTILPTKSDFIKQEKSPILTPTRIHFPPYKSIKLEPTSPILVSRSYDQNKQHFMLKSPILELKHSPKSSPRVKKKLFGSNREIETTGEEDKLKKINVINSLQRENENLDRRKDKNSFISDDQSNTSINVKISKFVTNLETAKKCDDKDMPDLMEKLGNKEIKCEKIISTKISESENSKTKESNLDDSLTMLKTSDSELAKKVASYFDSHFSSETGSQITITDSLTPKLTPKSDDIEIVSTITQIKSWTKPISEEKKPSPASSECTELYLQKSRKIRYKKGSLAYRLDSLVRKQTSSTSLWLHERFLAENSNFIIPKEEYFVFQIQKVNSKYDCVLLEAIDVNDGQFLIVINSCYVHTNNICKDMVFKLYYPHKVVDFSNNCKLIINACRFECFMFKK